MYSVSSEYTAAIQDSIRDMRNISVTIGGQTYYNQYVRGLTLHESVSEDSDRLLPGCAACASIETTVVASLSESLIGTEMSARSGVVLPDGSVGVVPLGVFVVQDIQRQPGTNITKITGYDRMCLLDGEDFQHRSDGGSKVRVTFKSLLDAIVPLDNSGAIQWATVPDYICDEAAPMTCNRPLDELHGYNCKELLGFIAGAHGKFARFNRSGLLEFAWYEDCGLTIPPKAISIGGLELRSGNDISDTVTFYSNDDVTTSGYGDYTNDLISSGYAAAADAITTVSSPGTMRYRGNPSIQAGDIVTVTLRDGTTRKFAVSDHTLRFGGGLSGSAESHGSAKHIFHKLNATQREIARLKKNYTITEEETTS